MNICRELQIDHLHVTEQGQGRPVLFVHGWCMSSAVWREQQQAVAAQHRYLALDLRGHGRSAMPRDGRSGFDAYAGDIVSLVEALELQDLTLVGWSLGAQACLKAWPFLTGRVSGLVLVGATPRFTASAEFAYGLPRNEAEGMRLKVRRNLERALEGFQRRMFTEGELADPVRQTAVAGVLADLALPDPAAALDGLESLMDEEVMREAALVDCPVLLLHGEQDRICLPQASRWLEQHCRRAERIEYPGCGHAPFLSRPEQFNRDLLGFVCREQRHG